jgi:hypothetical protein
MLEAMINSVFRQQTAQAEPACREARRILGLGIPRARATQNALFSSVTNNKGKGFVGTLGAIAAGSDSLMLL